MRSASSIQFKLWVTKMRKMKLNNATRLSLILFVMILSAVYHTSQVRATPTGLVNFWPADGNAVDVAGGNNGALINGAGFGPGVTGQAFSFNGAGQYVQASSPVPFGASDFSVDLWTNFNSVPGSNPTNPCCPLIADDNGPGNVDKWWLALGGGMLFFHLNSPSINCQGAANCPLAPYPFVPTLGQWYNIGVTRSDGIITMYVNCVRVSSQFSPQASNPTVPLTIGFAEGGSGTLNGLIDDVQIYNHGLTSSEVQSICHPVQLSVSKFFTDSSLNPLSLDNHGNPAVNVVLPNSIVRSTNPGEVIGWVNVTNTAGTPLQSLKINDTLPIDWKIFPAWLPAKGAIHVYYANTTSLATNPEITDSSIIDASTGNPETVHTSILSLSSTAIGHPLMPGQRVLLSVKLRYGLVKTSQPASSYPRNYTDTANSGGWTQESFSGTEYTGTGSASFIAETQTTTGLCSSGATLTIGELTDLTDGLSNIGTGVKDASLLAINDVNSFLVSSACNLKFAMSVNDYALDNTRALTDLQAFAAAGVQVVVGPLNSGTANYLLPFANANHIVLISPSASSPFLAIPNDYLFRTVPSDTVQSLAIARILVDRGAKAIILLQRHDAFGDGIATATATRFQQLGGTVIDTIQYDPIATDFTPQITTLNSDYQSANSTYPNQVAIVTISFEENNAILTQTNQQHPNLLNGRLPWFGTDGIALDTIITLGAGGLLAAQVKLPSPLYTPVSNAKTVAFESKFTAAYPGVPCDSFCLNAYDDVWLAALATLQAGSYTGTQIQAVMLTVASNYVGVTGSTLLDANGDRAASVSSYQIWKVLVVNGSPTWIIAGTWTGSSDTISWTSPP
jgi:branched-chain amino acid transport system substrate-binding protein